MKESYIRTQYRVEFTSPWHFANGAITPLFVLANDFQNDEECNWTTNLSIRGGLPGPLRRQVWRRARLLGELVVLLLAAVSQAGHGAGTPTLPPRPALGPRAHNIGTDHKLRS